MKKEAKREAVFEAIRCIIESEGRLAANELSNREEGAYAVLRKYLTSEEAVQAFEYAVELACKWAFESWFTAIDGCGADMGFTLALIDADTKEDLAPKDEMYHDAFSYYVFEREQADSSDQHPQ